MQNMLPINTLKRHPVQAMPMQGHHVLRPLKMFDPLDRLTEPDSLRALQVPFPHDLRARQYQHLCE